MTTRTAPHPIHEPTDQADLLDLIVDAESPLPARQDDIKAFLDACEADAALNGGVVNTSRVRGRLEDQGVDIHSAVVAPRFSGMWSKYTGPGKPMRKIEDGDPDAWSVCEGSESGNNGKPYRQRRWTGEGDPR